MKSSIFNGDIVVISVNTDNAIAFGDDMGLVNADLNVNIDDNNCENDGPETVIHVRLMAWCNKYRQRKANKKN